MELRGFGTTGRQVAVIGQGTWNIDRGDRAAAVAALRRGLDLGMTHIDTAEMYGDAEESRRRGDRRAARRGLPGLQGPSRERLAARHDRGLRAVARPPRDRPAGLLPPALARASTRWRRRSRPSSSSGATGKILSWGVSNFDVPDLEEACEIAGEGRLACNQVLYHLQERAIEHAVIPWCEEHGVAVVAYSPFGHGRFPGPGHRRRPRPAGDRRRARGDPAPGRAPVPGAASFALRDPQGLQPGARRRERGGRRPPADRGRARPDRRGLPARSPARASCPCSRRVARQIRAWIKGPPDRVAREWVAGVEPAQAGEPPGHGPRHWGVAVPAPTQPRGSLPTIEPRPNPRPYRGSTIPVSRVRKFRQSRAAGPALAQYESALMISPPAIEPRERQTGPAIDDLMNRTLPSPSSDVDAAGMIASRGDGGEGRAADRRE